MSEQNRTGHYMTKQNSSNLHQCLWQNSIDIDKGLNKSKYRTIHLILPLRIKIEKISKQNSAFQAFISVYAPVQNKIAQNKTEQNNAEHDKTVQMPLRL